MTRMMIMMHTVNQVAEMLQVGDEAVSQFVKSGEFDAIDVSIHRGKKKRLRISEDALRQFLERRRVLVPPPRSRSTQRPRPREIVDFFAIRSPEQNGRRSLKINEIAQHLGITDEHVRQLDRLRSSDRCKCRWYFEAEPLPDRGEGIASIY